MAPDVESEVSRRFSVLNRVRWVKRDGWHKKADQDRLRSFLSPWEEIIFAEVPVDDTVRYLRGECEAAGITPQRLSGLLGFSPTSGSIAPRRYLSVAGFAPIARDKYRELQEMTGRFARDYDELYRHFVKPTARDMTDVWDFDPVAPSVDKHPCEKPLEMMEFIILSSSRWGGSVLDSCSGSGSTLVAAKHLGRTAIGIEQDERWCEYAANRLAQGVLFGAAG
jgi:site-specific DNA-methyltransferase (adenine-specific)